MKKYMSEYETLRSEIISFQEKQRDVWIYMYVLFVTIFVLGMQLSYYLFLVTYMILIPFQVVINRFQWAIAKIATYIRLVYEDANNFLNWESMRYFDEFKLYYKKMNNDLIGIIRNTGVTQLAFLATIFFNAFLLYNKYDGKGFNLNFIDIFLLFISICLLLCTVILNKDFNRNYDQEWEVIIQKYKESLKENKEI